MERDGCALRMEAVRELTGQRRLQAEVERWILLLGFFFSTGCWLQPQQPTGCNQLVVGCNQLVAGFFFSRSEARAARSGGGARRGKVPLRSCRRALGAGGERERFLSRQPPRRVQIEDLHLPAVAGPRRVVGERACTSPRAEQGQRSGYSLTHPNYLVYVRNSELGRTAPSPPPARQRAVVIMASGYFLMLDPRL